MMFVTVTDGSDKKPSRQFTDQQSGLWQSNLFNNHIDVQVIIMRYLQINQTHRFSLMSWKTIESCFCSKTGHELGKDAITSWNSLNAKKSHLKANQFQGQASQRKMNFNLIVYLPILSHIKETGNLNSM